MDENPHIFDSIELFVVSPMRRTLQSLLLLLIGDGDESDGYDVGYKMKIIKSIQDKLFIQPLCSERANEECDIGLYPKSEVENWMKSNEDNIGLYKWFDLKMVDSWIRIKDKWWHDRVESVEEYEKRLLRLKEWLMNRQEKSIIVMCHSGVFGSLLNESVNNAGVVTVRW